MRQWKRINPKKKKKKAGLSWGGERVIRGRGINKKPGEKVEIPLSTLSDLASVSSHSMDSLDTFIVARSGPILEDLTSNSILSTEISPERCCDVLLCCCFPLDRTTDPI